MAKLIMDADKIKTAGDELISIANDYNTIIDEVYTKISNIPKEEVWVSESANGSANKFVSVALQDKESTKEFGKDIAKIGHLLNDYSDKINKTSDNKFEEDVWQK